MGQGKKEKGKEKGIADLCSEHYEHFHARFFLFSLVNTAFVVAKKADDCPCERTPSVRSCFVTTFICLLCVSDLVSRTVFAVFAVFHHQQRLMNLVVQMVQTGCLSCDFQLAAVTPGCV